MLFHENEVYVVCMKMAKEEDKCCSHEICQAKRLMFAWNGQAERSVFAWHGLGKETCMYEIGKASSKHMWTTKAQIILLIPSVLSESSLSLIMRFWCILGTASAAQNDKRCLIPYVNSKGPDHIKITYLYNFDPLKPHFIYILYSKTGVFSGIHNFSYFCSKT